MNTLRHIVISLALGVSILGSAQTKGTIKRAIGAKYTLAQSNDKRTDLVTSGSSIQLLKDDVVFGTTALVGAEIDGQGIIIEPPTSTYTNGKFERRGSTRFGRFLSDANYRSLLAGDKCWLIDVDVKDDGAILEFLSEPIHGVRYRALLKYPFAKGQIPSADAVLQQIAETITAEPLQNAGIVRQSPDLTGNAKTSPEGTTLALHTPETTHAKVILFDNYSYSCAEQLCSIRRNGLWGAIDLQGNQVIDFKYANALTFSEGVAVASDPGGSEQFYIDKRGARQFPGTHINSGFAFAGGVARVNTKEGERFIDHQGRLLATDARLVIDSAGFSEGLASFQSFQNSTEGQRRLLNIRGYVDDRLKIAITLPEGVMELRPFHEGLAWVQYAPAGQTPKWGAIDIHGKAVIPFQFSNAPGRFSDGLAAVMDTSGKVGYIDKTGALVIPCQFAYPDVSKTDPSGDKGIFINGHALVRLPGPEAWRLIDHGGKIVEVRGVTLMDRNVGPGIYSIMLPGLHFGLVEGDGSPLFVSTEIQWATFSFPDGPDSLAWAQAKINGRFIQGFVNKQGDFVVILQLSQF